MVIDDSNCENPTEKRKELYDHIILDGDIYLKIFDGFVVGATTNFEKAYNWFYDDECNIEVWNDDASFIIDNEEILDIYKQLGFSYTIEQVKQIKS